MKFSICGTVTSNATHGVILEGKGQVVRYMHVHPLRLALSDSVYNNGYPKGKCHRYVRRFPTLGDYLTVIELATRSNLDPGTR